LNIDPAAVLGAGNVTVTTGAEVVTLTNGFTVVANQPPTANAGPALAAVLLAPASLNGTVTGSSPLSVNWSTVSGPGSVVFNNPGATGTTATFDRLGNYVLRLTASNPAGTASSDLAVTVGCPANPYPVDPILFCDDFQRSDGPVGNGWSSWWGPTLDSPSTDITNGQLQTVGYMGLAGGIFRKLPLTFPVAFSFDFRTASPASQCWSYPFNDGGWVIGFNLPDSSIPSNFGGIGPAQLYVFHYSGQRNITRGYWDGTRMVQEPVLDGPVGNLRDYRAGNFARIDGIVNADLSVTVTIHYNDGINPDPVTVNLSALPSAANVPLGSDFQLSNANCSTGPHFFDNLEVFSTQGRLLSSP